MKHLQIFMNFVYKTRLSSIELQPKKVAVVVGVVVVVFVFVGVGVVVVVIILGQRNLTLKGPCYRNNFFHT